jgi:hypothetical protein
MQVEPGQTGIDAEFIGPKTRDPGFKYAELKPVSPNGIESFMKQRDNWNLTGKIQLWFYNPEGVIGNWGPTF